MSVLLQQKLFDRGQTQIWNPFELVFVQGRDSVAMNESRCGDNQIIGAYFLSDLFHLGPNHGMDERFVPGERQNRKRCFNFLDKF